MSYKVSITTETGEFKEGLLDLRTGLARTNWYLKLLGMPADQRKAITQMMSVIRTLRTLQMLVTATSIASGLTSVVRIAGLGRYNRVIKDLNRLGNIR